MDSKTGADDNTPREATSSEKQFRIKQSGFVPRLRRDIYIFRYLWRIIWMWLTVGRKIRRRRAEAERSGNIYYIDDIMGGGNV